MRSTHTKKPLRKDIVQQKIIGMIKELNLQPGDKLISEKKLASKFEVNHQTLRAAYSALSEKGILERRPSSGTFVKEITKSTLKSNFSYDSARTVIVALRDDPHFHHELKNCIIHKIEQNGMLPIVLTSTDRFSQENMQKLLQLNSIGARQLVINQSFILEDSHNIQFLRKHGAEFDNVVSLLGSQTETTGIAAKMVMGDYQSAMNTAVNKLKSLGHQKIGYFTGPMIRPHGEWNHSRRHAELYSIAMLNNDLAAGIEIRSDANMSVTTDKKQLQMEASELIQAGCSAILCENDYRAVIVIETAKTMGLTIPDDLSVVGFCDTPWAEHYNITTFKYRIDEIADAVIKYLNNPDSQSTLTLSEIDFIERNTTAKAKIPQTKGVASMTITN